MQPTNDIASKCIGFVPHPDRTRTVLVGDGEGIGPMITLAEELHEHAEDHWQPLVLLSSDETFPFRPRPSTILVPGMPDGVIACAPMMDDAGIPSRLASHTGYPGCHDGDIVELATLWLRSQPPEVLEEVEILACGPTPMLKELAALARRYDVPCQVAL
jgi:dihydroorotate dehydrogenase electron transfer subunit